MSLLDKIERRFRPFAVPHVTIALIAGQVMVYFLYLAQGAPIEEDAGINRLVLIADRVLAGEAWRLVTFLLVPPVTNPIFAFFFWYLFYLMGTSLERHWGVLRYNVYLLVAYIATVAVCFLLPGSVGSNAYLQTSVFLAFAYLFPDFALHIFFLLPVKIKWLALLTWIFYAWTLIFGGWLTKLLVLASIANFLLFFGRDIAIRIRQGHRRMRNQAKSASVRQPDYYHRCTVCGITDRSHPQMDFRYCSKCVGSPGYCMEHLHNHEHITETSDQTVGR